MNIAEFSLFSTVANCTVVLLVLFLSIRKQSFRFYDTTTVLFCQQIVHFWLIKNSEYTIENDE